MQKVQGSSPRRSTNTRTTWTPRRTGGGFVIPGVLRAGDTALISARGD